MFSPGQDKALEHIANVNALTQYVIDATNEINRKLPKVIADYSRAIDVTSRAYTALNKLDWETLLPKAIEEAQRKALEDARLKDAEELAALTKKTPQDVVWSGLVSASCDGVLNVKTERLVEQADLLSYQDAKTILNFPHSENDAQETIYIPESKRHSLFAQIAKAYAAWLGLKVVFLKEFSKVLELIKGKSLTLNSSIAETPRAKESPPPDFMLSHSLTSNAPPKNTGKPFTALLFLSCVSNSRKELIA